MIPNSGLVVHVLSNGVISLWAQWKHALLVMSEITHNFFSVAQQSKSGVGFLIVEVSRSHTHAQLDTHTHTARLLCTSNQLMQRPLLTQHTRRTREEHSCFQWDSNPQI